MESLLPCEGNCQFGDSGSVGMKACIEYDGSKCGCIKCPNFKLCHIRASPRYFGCHHGRCWNCNMFFRKNLAIRISDLETCCICLDEKTVFVGHPSECGHEMCIECFREQWWPEREDYGDPRDFGFQPTCPSDEDSDWEDELDKWGKNFPEQAKQWQNEQDMQDFYFEEKLKERSDPERCPLCRKHLLESNVSWVERK